MTDIINKKHSGHYRLKLSSALMCVLLKFFNESFSLGYEEWII